MQVTKKTTDYEAIQFKGNLNKELTDFFINNEISFSVNCFSKKDDLVNTVFKFSLSFASFVDLKKDWWIVLNKDDRKIQILEDNIFNERFQIVSI